MNLAEKVREVPDWPQPGITFRDIEVEWIEQRRGSKLSKRLPATGVIFRETQAAGIMLYRRNFETPERLARLLTGLEDALGRRLLVATAVPHAIYSLAGVVHYPSAYLLAGEYVPEVALADEREHMEADLKDAHARLAAKGLNVTEHLVAGRGNQHRQHRQRHRR